MNVQCPNCDHTYEVSTDAVGRSARCKYCGGTFVVCEAADAPPLSASLDPSKDVRTEGGQRGSRKPFTAMFCIGLVLVVGAVIAWFALRREARMDILWVEERDYITPDYLIESPTVLGGAVHAVQDKTAFLSMDDFRRPGKQVVVAARIPWSAYPVYGPDNREDEDLHHISEDGRLLLRAIGEYTFIWPEPAVFRLESGAQSWTLHWWGTLAGENAIEAEAWSPAGRCMVMDIDSSDTPWKRLEDADIWVEPGEHGVFLLGFNVPEDVDAEDLLLRFRDQAPVPLSGLTRTTQQSQDR